MSSRGMPMRTMARLRSSSGRAQNESVSDCGRANVAGVRLALQGARTLPIGPSAPLSKFVIHCSTTRHELRKQRGTSKFMILVPLFDLKFLGEFAAGGVGTSNRRH